MSQILKIFVNAAATMVLGMSNTYQQLITALDIEDISHVLTKYGDLRVGTNSPLAINHRSIGRVKAWAFWILLICTSLVTSPAPAVRVQNSKANAARSFSGKLPHWVFYRSAPLEISTNSCYQFRRDPNGNGRSDLYCRFE